VCSHAIPYSYPVFWQQVKNKVTKVTLCPNPVQTARWGYGGWPISGVSPVRFLYMIQQHINAVFNGGELCLRLSTRAPPQHLWEKPPQWSCHGTMGLGGSLPVDQEVPGSSLTGCGWMITERSRFLLCLPRKLQALITLCTQNGLELQALITLVHPKWTRTPGVDNPCAPKMDSNSRR
jgi:hypothetical protein